MAAFGVLPAEVPAQASRKYRLVGTEEACSVPEQVEAMKKFVATTNQTNADITMWRRFLQDTPFANRIRTRLLDMGQGRLDIMDETGVSLHVLSMTSPGTQMFDADTAKAVATAANDRMAEAIAKNPTRLAGIASIAPQDPRWSAKEIDRAINTLKLNGLVINSHTDEEYLDEEKYWPILEAAEACDAAIYIHPRNLPEAVGKLLRGKGIDMAGAFWGYQVETGMHAMRLIVAGIFDRFPNLKIVLGHMGEGIPYWLYRLDYMYRNYVNNHPGTEAIKRAPSDYVKSNIVVTTSGMNYHPTLKYCHEVLGPDNIMFAIDYPYQETLEAAEFMNTAPLPPEDIEKIAHLNAERVFHIKHE